MEVTCIVLSAVLGLFLLLVGVVSFINTPATWSAVMILAIFAVMIFLPLWFCSPSRRLFFLGVTLLSVSVLLLWVLVWVLTADNFNGEEYSREAKESFRLFGDYPRFLFILTGYLVSGVAALIRQHLKNPRKQVL